MADGWTERWKMDMGNRSMKNWWENGHPHLTLTWYFFPFQKYPLECWQMMIYEHCENLDNHCCYAYRRFNQADIDLKKWHKLYKLFTFDILEYQE